MTPAAKTRLIREIAHNLGIDRIGVAPAIPLSDGAYYRDWLARGYAGSMAYLHRYQDLREDPSQLIPGAKSIICAAVNHRRDPNESALAPESKTPTGQIAAYARGPDYHVALRNLLDQLVSQLRSRLGEQFNARTFVDTGPLLERSLAARAGLGWIGKNTLLMHQRTGSYLFLGEVVTTLELAPDQPMPDHCGSCTRCLDACPTQAFPAPYVLNASRCISYFTIEHRGDIPDEFHAAQGDWVYGCDVCQEVCPHNARAPLATLPPFCESTNPPRVPLTEWMEMDQSRYKQITRSSAISRAKRAMLQRNAGIAFRNAKRAAALDANVDKGVQRGYQAGMNARLSQCAQSIAPSATLALQEKIAQLRAQGVKVIGFGAGEPDFDTPPHIVAAANAALARKDTRYAPVAGKPELRDAICKYMQQYCGVEYKREQTCVTVGTKDGLHIGFRTLLDPGDEAIIPAPFWLSYPDQVRLAGGLPVIVKCSAADGYKLTPAVLQKAITAQTRMLVLNSPSNPTGAVYSRAEQEALAEVLRPTEIVVVSDEIYHRLVYGPNPFVSFAAMPGMFDRTLTVSGVGKTFAMTGWRLGFAAGPAHVVSAMARIQGQTTSGATTFVQAAAIEALAGAQSCVADMLAAYRRRAQHMTQRLNAIPGVTCAPPHGAFYCFADVSAACARMGLPDAAAFAERALAEVHVAVIGGAPFGAPQHIRMSFATADENITEGLNRLAQLLS